MYSKLEFVMKVALVNYTISQWKKSSKLKKEMDNKQ